jgi:hypothetical protein
MAEAEVKAPELDVVAPRAHASAAELDEAKAAKAAVCANAQDVEACMGVVSHFQYPRITRESIQYQECFVAKIFRSDLDDRILVADFLAYISSHIERVFACGHLADSDARWDQLFASPAGTTIPVEWKDLYTAVEGNPADHFADYIMATSAGSKYKQTQIKPEWPFVACLTEVFVPVVDDKGRPRTKEEITLRQEKRYSTGP